MGYPAVSTHEDVPATGRSSSVRDSVLWDECDAGRFSGTEGVAVFGRSCASPDVRARIRSGSRFSTMDLTISIAGPIKGAVSLLISFQRSASTCRGISVLKEISRLLRSGDRVENVRCDSAGPV